MVKKTQLKVYALKLLLLSQTKEFKNGNVKNIKQVSLLKDSQI